MSFILLNVLVVLGSIFILLCICTAIATMVLIFEITQIAKNIRKLTDRVDTGTVRIINALIHLIKK